MIVLVPDTNFFLHCREISALPLIEKFGEDTCLLITSPVVKEIDNLKSKGEGRKARRAREWARRFRQFVESVDIEVYGIKTKLNEHRKISSISFPEDFEITDNDSRIVAEAYLFQRTTNDDVIFMSNDTMPLVHARTLKLKLFDIPDDWLLPPQPDNRDNQISKLKSDLAKHQSNLPTLSVEMKISDKLIGDNFDLTPIHVKPLSRKKVKEIIECAKKMYPQEENPISALDFQLDALKSIHAYSSGTMVNGYEKYSRKYGNFLKDVKWYFASFLPTAMAFKENRYSIVCNVQNISTTSAQNIQLEISVVEGDIGVVDKLVEIDDLSMPSAPDYNKFVEQERKTRYGESFYLNPFPTDHLFPKTPSILPPKEDNVFYSIEVEEEQCFESALFSCPNLYPSYVAKAKCDLSAKNCGESHVAKLRVLIRGKNLPNPIEKYFSISVNPIQKKLSDYVNVLEVPSKIKDILRR